MATVMPPSNAPTRPGPKTPDGWRDAVLEEIRRHGGMYRAARNAGVTPMTVWRHMQADAEFADAVRDAREELADDLAGELVQQARDTGNPVGYIVRLKALRPAEYIEKNVTVNLSATAEVPQREVLGLLRAALGGGMVTDATMRALTGGMQGETQDERDEHDQHTTSEPTTRDDA